MNCLRHWTGALAGIAFVAGVAWGQAAPDMHGTHQVLPPTAEAVERRIPTDSIYHLDSQWLDQDGARIPLGALRGKPQIVAMIYTNCEYVCPLIVDEMKRVEQALPADVREQVVFSLFSFDPERDSVAVLKAYAAKRNLDGRRWRLYTGQPDDVLELAAVLGVRFRKEPNGDFSHSTIITVLDRSGVIRHQLLGLKQDDAPLLEAVKVATKG